MTKKPTYDELQRRVLELERGEAERKRVEAALEESEGKYRLLADNVTDVIWLLDLNLKFVYVSPSVEKLRGYSPEEAMQRTLEQTLAPESYQKIVQTVTDELKIEGQPGVLADRSAVLELDMVCKDGSTILAEVRASFLRDKTGRITGILGITRDITKRKQVEEALEKRMIALTRPLNDPEGVTFEDLFNLKDIQSLQDQFAAATGVASIITDTDGTPITKPSRFCRLCADIIRNTEKGRLNCHKSDAVIGGRNPAGPTIQPCLSGGLWDAGAAISVGGRHVANWLIGQVRDETQTDEKMRAYAREIGADEEDVVRAFYDVPAMSREHFGKVSQALFTFADQLSKAAYQNVQQARFISDIKQAEKNIQQSEKTYRNLLGNLNAGVVVHAPDTSVQIANTAVCHLLGISEDQLVGKKDTDLQWHFLREDGGALPREDYPVNRILRTKTSLTNTVLGLKRPLKEDVVWILINGFAQLDGSGGVEQVIITFVDVTDRKRADEEKEKLENQLRQALKMEAVGRLAGGVAHDFNNMLSVIIGQAEMALYTIDPTHPLHTALNEIKKAGERSADLTRQLLAFARKQTVSPRVLDLNKIVSGMTSMLKRIIGEAINLVWLPGKNVTPVKMDPGQIDQILVNLCVNARDAIADVGNITIETGNFKFNETYCNDHMGAIPGEYVLIAVSDDGCGMTTETRQLIFEPFFTTKESGKGTGLGLATVYGVVKQNNGFIDVDSELDKGTTFKIYLPRYMAGAHLPEGKKTQPVKRGDETILLVEDEPAILGLAKTMLEKMGYRVVVAGTPGKAIRLAQEHTGEINLLLTDVIMPEMNGRDLAKNILSIYPDLKRLFMSGYTANVIAHHGVLDEGVNFIQKPFSRDQLSAKVREVLDQ